MPQQSVVDALPLPTPPSGPSQSDRQSYLLRLCLVDDEGIPLGRGDLYQDYVIVASPVAKITGPDMLVYELPAGVVEYVNVSFIPWAREALGEGRSRVSVAALQNSLPIRTVPVEPVPGVELTIPGDVKAAKAAGWFEELVMWHFLDDGLTIPPSWDAMT